MNIKRALLLVTSSAIFLSGCGGGCGARVSKVQKSTIKTALAAQLGVQVSDSTTHEELFSSISQKIKSLESDYNRLRSESSRLEHSSFQLWSSSGSRSNESRMALIRAEQNREKMDLITKQIEALRSLKSSYEPISAK